MSIHPDRTLTADLSMDRTKDQVGIYRSRITQRQLQHQSLPQLPSVLGQLHLLARGHQGAGLGIVDIPSDKEEQGG